MQKIKIVAIGGGLNGRTKCDGTVEPYETGPMDEEIIRLTGKEKPHFLFIAHSQPTTEIQDGYFKTMQDVFGKRYGLECKHLRSCDLSNTHLTKSLVDWADIIYEGGGNTLDMIKLWHDTSFDTLLRGAFEDGKVLCGVFAGANCWFKECSSDSLKIKYGSDQPLIKVDCLGFVDGLFVPHYDEEGRLENVKELLKDSLQVAICISNCAALEIVGESYRIITSSASAYGLKCYFRDGKYFEEKLDTSLEFKPLKELFL